MLDAERLARAAIRAVYCASDYHCRGAGGQPPKTRAKPASICPRYWPEQEGTAVLRAAIRGGHVSEVWDDDFPRYVWHRDGAALYEARHTSGPSGTYHAYPIEDAEAPRGLRV